MIAQYSQANAVDGLFYLRSKQEGEAKKEIAPEFVEAQKAVDGPLLGGLSDELKGYLGTRFGLKSGDRPHLMKF